MLGEITERLLEAATALDNAWLGDAELMLDCALPAYLRQAATALLSLQGELEEWKRAQGEASDNHASCLLRLADIRERDGQGGVWTSIRVDELRALEARAQAAEALLSEAREGLSQAAMWFEEYADHHQAKGALDKASRNLERANHLRRAISGASRELAPTPGAALGSCDARHAEGLRDRIGERIADEVEKALYRRQTNCEQAAADILGMVARAGEGAAP